MAGSVNKVILVGNLGADPDVRTMQSGDRVVNLSVATGESWKDKNTGERREKTEWHRVVVFNPGLVTICENYLRKGSKVYLEGQLETRSWEQDGQKKYATEVVLRPYRGELTMLDGRGDNQGGYQQQQQAAPMAAAGGSGAAPQASSAPVDPMEDDIPF